MTNAQHRLLYERWEAHKHRFGSAEFVDEQGKPIPEFLLTDTDSRILMGDSLVSDDEAEDDDEARGH